MRTILTVAVLTLLAFAGCLDDGDASDAVIEGAPALLPPGSHPDYGFQTYLGSADDPLWGGPEPRALPDPLTTIDALAHVEGTSTGGGIAVFGPYAYIGGRGSGPLQIVDIQDPEAPVIVGEVADVPVRDADTIAFPADADHPEGRLVVITTAGGANMFATDVTDPANARMLAQFETEHRNHNIAVVPGTPIVYNSGSGGLIDIVDFSDPENPVQVGTFQNDEGCHDITFYVDAVKQRAYCAAYPETQIWDIADPTAPEMVVRIPYPTMEQGTPIGDVAPGTTALPPSFSHLAMVNHDASVLIMGDETGGGAINGCDYYAETPVGTQSGPSGNLWFYDLTDEAEPELRGHVSPSALDADGSCTAHFGRVLEDSGHLVMGFYAAGVVLVDFTDLDNPAIKDRYDPEPLSSIWDVWYHQGYLFTGDMGRGMDVLTLG